MIERDCIRNSVFVTALLMVTAAQAFDNAEYPDFSGAVGEHLTLKA